MQRRSSEEVSSTSNYMPSPGATSHKYDVFLSFRGPDTRKGFTSHLYDRLTCHGISVFKDEVNMVEGEVINDALKTAINDSKIRIPIFSKTYASSKACLQELSHMMLKRESIIPIFYDVGADDVKLKTDLYKKALEDHYREGKVGKEEIEQWKKALLEVGKILGYNIVDKNEADEITKITRQVLNQSTHKYQNLNDHFVEIDNKVEYVMKMLDLNSDGCLIIGLWGMGGIGKTTLAKLVFNLLYEQFGRCCSFIEDVRESVQNKKLLMLQRQLYKDLIDGRSFDSINDINSGINMIKKGLENKKFLLVLDDVDDENVLTNFVGDRSRLANGSRIIITTRNKRVLDALADDSVQQSSNDRALIKVFQVQQLDGRRALQLFSKCAFQRDSPPEKFMSLSKDAIFSLGGLPLALEVIGSLLRGRSKKAWEDTMKRLKTTPNEKIQTSLMISYNNLHGDEKKIFLDIACYPESLQKIGAYYMWKSCEWHPNLSIENLINQSLVKVDKHDRLWMHDVLKDFGREIIREEQRRNGREFQKVLQICDILGGIPNEERKYVEMLQIGSWRGLTVISNDLIGFENVRFLTLKAQKIEGNFEGLFPNLRWITMEGVRLFQATNFNPENLVVLQFRYSFLQVIKSWWSQMKAHKLQVLEIVVHGYVGPAPNFKEFSSLEVLTLEGCSQLVNSMGDLKKLIHIRIDRGNLASLPPTISDAKDLEEIVFGRINRKFKLSASVYNLENLSRLCLMGVGMGELEDSIGNLVSLCELDLSYTSIEVLPNAIGQLKQLKILRISGSQIRKFPPTIGNLMKLEEIEAVDCQNFEGDVPSEIGVLPCLRILDFSCTPICRIQKLPSSLTHLIANSLLTDIEICSSSLLELTNVVELVLRCSDFDVHFDQVHPRPLDFRWICKSPMLEELDLHIPYVISGLEGVNGLSRLERLDLTLAEFQDPVQLPSTLSSLELNDCKFPHGILDVSNAKKKLSTLEILRCDMREIRGLTEMDSLNYLSISRSRNLSSLKLWNCTKLQQLDEFDGLESLTDLSIRDCASLETFGGFSKVRSLSSIELWNCKNLHRINVLDGLESLTDLSIRDCPSLTSSTNILRVGSLSSVELWNCGNLVQPDMFSRLDYLTHLSIKDLGINSLNLVACGKLESIEEPDGLASLTDLSIEDCPSLRNLPNLSKLVNLRSLTLRKLERLRCIQGLKQLEFLEVVDITACQSLELDPDDLCKLNNMRRVVITDCNKRPRLL